MANILIAVTGGIAAYKTASLVSYLAKENTVNVMMSKHATDFVTPLTFQTLSKNKVMTDMRNTERPEIIDHIHYPQKSDIMVIAPATANIVAKAAHGIADDLISTSILAATIPIVFVPSMNENMYANPITQSNIKILKERGYHIIEPAIGNLACGACGKGKFPPLEHITDTINRILHITL